ncbi:MAG: M48 family metalloprotease [Thermoguttaceae bacterium]|nr:M48 family metalloprotease [Thermoguttaceae bacterium]
MQRTTRRMAAGAAVVLILLTLVWLVRSEGRRNRAAIREAAEQVDVPQPAEVAENAERVVESASEAAGRLVREVGRVLRGPEDTPPDETRVELADRQAGKPNLRAEEENSGGAVPEPGAEDRLGNLFGNLVDLARETARELDDVGQEVLRLSPKEETRVGREIHAAVGREQVVRAMPQLARLAAPLVPPGEREKYRFFVMKSDELNAFAHVGGYVYVTSEALKVFADDLQLQFLLAHEIAHIHLGHSSQRVTYAARAAELAGPMAATATQLAYLAVALGYSQEQELEADAWAFRAMLALGHRRENVLNALRRMQAHIPKGETDRMREAPRGVPQRVWHEIEDHLSSHPPFAERIERLESLPAADRR